MKFRSIIILLSLVLLLAGCSSDKQIPNENFTYARSVSDAEIAQRDRFVASATEQLGINEKDGSHKSIVDIYNAHKPLAQGYIVSYSDEWCATFVSTISIQCGMTDIIPTECSCERQIKLFDGLGCWIEDDAYVPLPGDIIYYRLDNKDAGDCTKWANHVGIVIGTYEGKIRVIEGNNSGKVAYRTLPVDDPMIRGFAVPDFAALIEP
ncbi:MAG: CHAP domain-containing protein [Oscillospiraceae bacterium]|nr:CHAP domain-containing protein [Oscillospiraceae bacterium]